MMDDTPFAGWRDEIEAEHTEAVEALAAAAETMHKAKAAHATAAAQHQALRDAIATLRQPVSSALARRVRASDELEHDAAQAVARAHAELTTIQYRVTVCEQTLREISQLMPPPEPEAVPVELEDVDAS